MNFAPVFALIFLASGVVYTEYLDPDESKWPGLCTTGKKQSPIALDKDKAEKRKMSLNFDGYDNKVCATLVNVGSTVSLRFNKEDNNGVLPSISGDGLDGKYVLAAIFFHWDAHHPLDGQRYDLETDLVHDSVKYNSHSEALSAERGVATLGVLSQTVPNSPAKELEQLVSNVPQTPDAPPRKICDLDLNTFLPKNRNSFYRYEGSRPVPTCEESTIWTVFTEVGKIDTKQLYKLTNILGPDGQRVKKNSRNPQPLNDRKVYLTN